MTHRVRKKRVVAKKVRKDFLFFLRFIQTDPLPPTPLDLRHIAAGGAAAGGGEGEIGLVGARVTG